MDAASIANNLVGLQKQSFNNIMDSMIIFQGHAEKTSRLLIDQIVVNEKTQEVSDQWRTVLIKRVKQRPHGEQLIRHEDALDNYN